MRRLIQVHGPCGLVPELRRSPFEALVTAVAHQQLHGKAAETILGRFRALFAPARFPTAARLAEVSDDALRGCGFSRAKTAALRDIAEKTLSRVVPSSRVILRMRDEEIIERLITVRGVGRWTVEMLLIFKLGRPDVLPVDDFGVRNGFRISSDCPQCPRLRKSSPSANAGVRTPPPPHGTYGEPPTPPQPKSLRSQSGHSADCKLEHSKARSGANARQISPPLRLRTSA